MFMLSSFQGTIFIVSVHSSVVHYYNVTLECLQENKSEQLATNFL